MKRVHFEQWVRVPATSSHHEGKELREWHQDMTEDELELLRAQEQFLRDLGGKVHIVKVEDIGEGDTE